MKNAANQPTSPTLRPKPPALPTAPIPPPPVHLPLHSGEGKETKRSAVPQSPRSPTAPANVSAPTSVSTVLQLSCKINYTDLTIGRRLGAGGFGEVFQGTWQHNDVAIKRLHINTLSVEAEEELKREAEIMAQIRFPQVVAFYGLCMDQSPYCMVMELMPKGSLYHVLHNAGEQLPWPLRYRISIDIAVGMSHLHYRGILHRDLKSLNILLDDRFRAKISDFGLSKIKNETSTTTKLNSGGGQGPVGSILWMAPELFKRGGQPTKFSDMYSFAITLWEIASRKNPWEEAHDKSLVVKWVQDGERETIPTDCPEEFTNLLQTCWDAKPENRQTADEAVKRLREGLAFIEASENNGDESTGEVSNESNSTRDVKEAENKLMVSIDSTVNSGQPTYLDNAASGNQLSPQSLTYADNFFQSSRPRASHADNLNHQNVLMQGLQSSQNSGVDYASNLGSEGRVEHKEQKSARNFENKEDGVHSGESSQSPQSLLDEKISVDLVLEEKQITTVRIQYENTTDAIVGVVFDTCWKFKEKKLKIEGLIRLDPFPTSGRQFAFFGNLEALQQVFKSGSERPSQLDKFKATPLHYACVGGHLKVVEWLLNEDKDLLALPNMFEKDALAYAALNGHLEIMQFLLSKKEAMANDKNNWQEKLLSAAAEGGQFGMIVWLLQRWGSSINDKINYSKVIVSAAYRGHLPIMEWLSKKSKLSPLGRDESNTYGWINAITRGHFEAVKWLIQKQIISVHSRDSFGNTPLIIAASEGNLPMVKWLVQEAKASVQERQYTPDNCIEKPENLAFVKGRTALLFAAARGHFPVVQWLLLEAKASISERTSDGNTALEEAAQWQPHKEIVLWLLSSGFFAINERDIKGDTLLLKLKKEDKSRGTYYFTERDKWLIEECGASPNIKNKAGENFFSYIILDAPYRNQEFEKIKECEKKYKAKQKLKLSNNQSGLFDRKSDQKSNQAATEKKSECVLC